MDLDQIDDSLLVKETYIKFLEQTIEDKNYFKAALAYQEIVKQRYHTFFLELYAEYWLHDKRVSDGAVRITDSFADDT